MQKTIDERNLNEQLSKVEATSTLSNCKNPPLLIGLEGRREKELRP